MRSFNRLSRLVIAGFFLSAVPVCPAQAAGSGGVNASGQLDKPYLVLVSLDGFRWDYPDRYPTPAISRLIEEGFRAQRLLPVFPTLTFPNHYSIATGLFPSRHGLVGNRFPAPELDEWYQLSRRETVEDGRFYAGEPIWVTAEQQGMVTAAFFFVGTEAAIAGVRPSHWRSFTKSIKGEERVDQALAWLAEPPASRPHLLTLYFEDVDDHTHWSGVGSDLAIEAIQRVDGYLDRLLIGIDALPHGDQVNVVVVSDHGQASYLPEAAPLVLDEHIDLNGIRIVGMGSYSFLYFAEPDPGRIRQIQSTIQAAWPHGQALTPDQAPDHWQLEDNGRWPHLLLIPDLGHAVVRRRIEIERLHPGTHGWSPDDEAMHGVLFGAGPNLRPGSRLGAVRSVDVLPLLLNILSLPAPEGIDSNAALTRPALALP